MTDSQHNAMIRFAKRVEAAYRSVGDTANAEQAHAHLERLEAMIFDDQTGKWVNKE